MSRRMFAGPWPATPGAWDVGRTGACRPAADRGIGDGPVLSHYPSGRRRRDLTWVKGRSARARPGGSRRPAACSTCTATRSRSDARAVARPMPSAATAMLERHQQSWPLDPNFQGLCDLLSGRCARRPGDRDDQARRYELAIAPSHAAHRISICAAYVAQYRSSCISPRSGGQCGRQCTSGWARGGDCRSPSATKRSQ